MPGFVDVSNMSDQEIKRLSQIDDVDYQPRRKVAPTRPASTKFSIGDVWAAACAANRINGGYFKEAVHEFDEVTQLTKVAHRRNREVMMDFLTHPENLTVADVERGEHCRQFLQSDLTFRTLKGKVSEFDSAIRKVLAVTDHFDNVYHRYELAIVASLPASVERTEVRQNAEQRVRFAQGGLIGKVGDKVTTTVEVIAANYSKEHNIYWIRGITDQDQPVFFSNKEKFDVGTHLTVQGKVKAHKDNLTQLNYVKVL